MIAGAGLTNRGAEPRHLLLEAPEVLLEQLLYQSGLPRLEVQGPYHPEQGRHAPPQLRAQVAVQPLLEARPGDEVQRQPLQGVRLGKLLLQVVEEPADGLLLLLRQGHLRLVRFKAPLVLPLADGHPLLRLERVLRGEPAPDGQALRVHGLRERGHGRRHVRARRGRREGGPEAVELRLVGQVPEDVMVMLGVHADQLPVDVRGFLISPQEHAEARLHLQKP
mmetsp:Transcript_106707/g.278571  ORF Transcript_106707/g.278571 Transcript_106707/m.278571 type:complete len:222 (-) Transcript_106707:680-1345(-)